MSANKRSGLSWFYFYFLGGAFIFGIKKKADTGSSGVLISEYLLSALGFLCIGGPITYAFITGEVINPKGNNVIDKTVRFSGSTGGVFLYGVKEASVDAIKDNGLGLYGEKGVDYTVAPVEEVQFKARD